MPLELKLEKVRKGNCLQTQRLNFPLTQAITRRDFLADKDRYGTKEVLCADKKERDFKPTSKATTTSKGEGQEKK